MSAGLGGIEIAVIAMVAAVGILGLVLAFSADNGGLRAVGIILCALVGLSVVGVGTVVFFLRPSPMPPTPIASGPIPVPKTASGSGGSAAVAIRGESIRIIVHFLSIPTSQKEPLRDALTQIVHSNFEPFSGGTSRSRTTTTNGEEVSGNLMFTFDPADEEIWDECFAAAQTAIEEIRTKSKSMGLDSSLVIRLTDGNNIDVEAGDAAPADAPHQDTVAE